MLIYSAQSYKQVLRDGVVRPKTFQAMAAHCGIQKTYLSKVLSRDGDLSEDQLYLALEYIDIDSEAASFVLDLYRWERSQLTQRKVKLRKKIDAVIASKFKTESNLKLDKAVTKSDLTEYYLDPLYQVVHMYLMIPRFAKTPSLISGNLLIPPRLLEKYLSGLERMKIISINWKNKEILSAKVIQDDLHLSEDSPLHKSYVARMRIKTIERLDMQESNVATSFSVIFSADKAVRQRIRESFNEWLSEIRKQVQASRSDEVYQINFDLLNW